MNAHILSAGVLDPIGPAARGPLLVAFLGFIGVSLLWLFMLAAGQDETPESLYVADRSLSAVFNGFALAGEHISVITLLGTSGLIALVGYDGFTIAVDSLLALGVLLLLAQKVRNSGRYTLADIFSLRVSGPEPRMAADLVTLAITVPVLMVQLRAAGVSTALLIGLPRTGVEVVCTVLMGSLVACFASLGGLRATSFMHIAKVPLVLVTLALLSLLSLRLFAWDPGDLLSTAVKNSVAPDRYLSPGLWQYAHTFGPLNTVGTHVAVILGAATMPHMLLRLNASRTGRSARRSVSIAVGLFSIFLLLLITAGFASAAVVGGAGIAADASGQSSLILLASHVLDEGSPARTALIILMGCVIFLTVLTTVASVTFAAAVSLTHGVRARGRRVKAPGAGTRTVRVAAVAVGVGGLSLSAVTHGYPTDFLTTFSLSAAASCIFPALVYSLFWRRFRRRGLLWSVYGGLLLCTILTLFSGTVSGTSFALFPTAHFNWYPFQVPGLVSIPAAFFLGWLGSVTCPGDSGPAFRHIEFTTATGLELERDTSH
ncbi:transporter [Streptomyces sp. NPDC005374]|uniref:sodium:solute symporter family transporter n=1 Tax=Streptomyces sp. NPDC005374 TaxID=3364713 RepID=UPI0036C05E12